MVPAEPGLQRNSRTCLVKHLFRPKYPATKADNPGLHCLPVRCKPCEIQLAQEKHVFTWICGFPQQDQVFQCFKNPLDWKTENTHLTCSAHSSRHAVITLTEGPPNSILDARFFFGEQWFHGVQRFVSPHAGKQRQEVRGNLACTHPTNEPVAISAKRLTSCITRPRSSQEKQ